MLPLAETAFFLDILVARIGSPAEVAKLKLLQQLMMTFFLKKNVCTILLCSSIYYYNVAHIPSSMFTPYLLCFTGEFFH